MDFKTDVTIAQETTMKPIVEIAEKLGINDKAIEQYGKYKAKINELELTDFFFLSPNKRKKRLANVKLDVFSHIRILNYSFLKCV